MKSLVTTLKISRSAFDNFNTSTFSRKRSFTMCDTKIKLHIVLVVLCIAFRGLHAVDDTLLFSVTRAPRYFGILQDHRGQPLSVEVSEEYMDQDYIATNRKRHKIDWNKNPLDMDDFEDDDTEEIFDEKDKDVKLPNKFNLQAGPV